jgi:lipid A 4'-phosphatase
MNRTGLLIALGIAGSIGLLFGVFPGLDIAVSALFFDPASKSFVNDLTVIGPLHPTAAGRDISMWVVAALAVPAAIALLFKLLAPRTRLTVPARASLFLLITLALAPGILANVLLKEHWGRPRPIDIREFAGTDQFVPWWDPRGQCPHNCSFITGEGAGAFWTLAPAALTPAQLRPFAYAMALTFGAAVGTLRIAYGGHFLTDVVASGVLTFVLIWGVHGLLYRWRSAVCDRQLESSLEQRIAALQAGLARSLRFVRSLLRRAARRTRTACSR